MQAGAIPKQHMDSKGKPALVEALLRFFGVASSDEWERHYARMEVSFHRTRAEQSDIGAISAWLRFGEIEAERLDGPRYDRSRFEESLEEIRMLTVQPQEDFEPRLNELCRKSGVTLVLVPAIPRAHVSGVARWLSSQRPLIQLPLHGKTNDRFLVRNRTANEPTRRLSLRPPQRRSLEILDRIMDIFQPGKDAEAASLLEIIRSDFPSVSDFERDFPSLCFALATGVGKTRLMGAFISYLHLAHGIGNFFVMASNLTIYNKLIAGMQCYPSKRKPPEERIFKGALCRRGKGFQSVVDAFERLFHHTSVDLPEASNHFPAAYQLALPVPCRTR